MKIIKYRIILIFLIGFMSVLYSQSTLYYKGKVFTADLKESFIGIVENGIISETGDTLSYERIAHFKNKTDLQGKTIIPGFVDNPIHFIDGSLGLLQISLSDINDSSELRKRVSETLANRLDGVCVARDLGFSSLSKISNQDLFIFLKI